MDIDVLIVTQKGLHIAMLKGLDDDSLVKTRVSQYEASKNGKGSLVHRISVGPPRVWQMMHGDSSDVQFELDTLAQVIRKSMWNILL